MQKFHHSMEVLEEKTFKKKMMELIYLFLDIPCVLTLKNRINLLNILINSLDSRKSTQAKFLRWLVDKKQQILNLVY
jgi:hypothetical protein